MQGSAPEVLTVAQTGLHALLPVADRYGLTIHLLDESVELPGSFWGAPEAGIAGLNVYVSNATPVHSFLHESAHIICMPSAIRESHTGDAASDDLEEAAVCYLQVLLADLVVGADRDRIIRDMDAWGYSFRLGSTRRWFEEDADQYLNWLIDRGILDKDGGLTFALRGAS